MEYWLGISKLNTYDDKIIIESEDGFNIIINLEKDEKFLYNQCLKGKNFKSKNVKITKLKGTESKQIIGFPKFISNLGLVIKKHIMYNKISGEKLDSFYVNIFNIIKHIIEQ